MTDKKRNHEEEFAEINGEEVNEQPSNFKDRAKRFFKGE